MKANVLRVHELKVNPEYFHDLSLENKRGELRPDDRDFRIGDYLHLTPHEPRRPDSVVSVNTMVLKIVGKTDRNDTFGKVALRPGWVLLYVEKIYGERASAIEAGTVVHVVKPRAAKKAKRR